jgi:hypothetical protein
MNNFRLLNVRRLLTSLIFFIKPGTFAVTDTKTLPTLKLELGIDSGGETLAKFNSSNGQNYSIDAGKGIAFKLGLSYIAHQTASTNYEFQGLVGYKSSQTPKFANGISTWSHNPVDFLFAAHFPKTKIRLAAGLTRELNNNFKGEGDFQKFTTSFRDSTGMVLAGEYLAFTYPSGQTLAFGGRLTRINYTPKLGGPSANGDAYGLTITFY